MIFNWLYQQYGQLPKVNPFIYGIKPAVIAIILGAIYRLSKKALKNIELSILGTLTLIAYLLGVNKILALFVCVLMCLILYFIRNSKNILNSFTPLFLLQVTLTPSTLKILWSFFKVGTLLYGSGYVLILIAAISLIAVFVFKKMNSAFIVIGGSLIGYFLSLM